MRYRVLVKSFINGRIYDPEEMSGDQLIVEYDGIPGSNLQPLDKSEPPKKVSTKEAQARLHAAAEVGDPNAKLPEEKAKAA